jgi:hypothetical protein
MPQLTQDILDLIVDDLAVSGKSQNEYRYFDKEARQALANCALSSSVLCHRAQAYLFNVFVVNTRKKSILTKHMATDKPGLTQHTKRLRVHPGIPGREDWMYSPSEYDLSKILPLFPNIESVSLANLSLDHFGTDHLTIENAFASLTSANIQRLSCSTWDNSSDAQFVRLLKIIHRTLNTLQMSYCEWKADPGSFPRDLQPFCALEQLRITALYGTSSISYPWFTCLQLHNLKILHFSLCIGDDVKPWQRVLDSAPLIRTLGISHVIPYPYQIDLRRLLHLESLEVSSAQIWDPDVIRNNTDPIAPLLEVIRTTQSPRLAEVTVQFEYDHSGFYRKVDWNNAKKHREHVRSVSRGATFKIELRGAAYEEGGGSEILEAVAEMRAAAEAAGLSTQEVDSKVDKLFRPKSD